MDLKGGISWKIGKYKTALRKIKLAYFFYILSNLTCFLSFFKSCYDCVRLTKTCYSTYMLLLFWWYKGRQFVLKSGGDKRSDEKTLQQDGKNIE